MLEIRVFVLREYYGEKLVIIEESSIFGEIEAIIAKTREQAS